MDGPYEKLLSQLWNTLTEKGIGPLLKPWQIKREGMAHLEMRRIELLALAQAEKDAEDIRTGKKRLEDFPPNLTFAATDLAPLQDKRGIEPTIDLPAVVEAAARQAIGDAVRRQVNVAHAIVHAEEALRDDPQPPPDERINDEWLYRWRDYAGDVSDKTMQELWGRILAGELKAPSTFSLRTLDFLRNLSPDEARAIERLSKFVIDNSIWGDEKSTLEENGLSFSSLLELQNLGVLSGVESLGGLQIVRKSNDNAKYIQMLRSNGSKALLVRHDNPKKEMTLQHIYVLTTIGRQILRLVSSQPQIDYLQRVGEIIQAQGFSVTIADFVQVSDTKFNFFNEKAIEAQPTVQANGTASGGATA